MIRPGPDLRRLAAKTMTEGRGDGSAAERNGRNKIIPAERRWREESGGLHYYHNLIQERKSVACPADPVGVETQWRSFFYCAPNLPSPAGRSFAFVPFNYPRRPVRLLFVTRHRQIILSAPLPTPISIHSIDRFGFSRRPGRLVAHCSSIGTISSEIIDG